LFQKKMPHEKVYARLGCSDHGVGVFAIKKIPKGAYIFDPDDALASVPVMDIEWRCVRPRQGPGVQGEKLGTTAAEYGLKPTIKRMLRRGKPTR
jgi:hypothetical protein